MQKQLDFLFPPKNSQRNSERQTHRPIISGNECPAEMFTAFVDEHLKSYIKQVPHVSRALKSSSKRLKVTIATKTIT